MHIINRQWWKEVIIYQIYPRSFKDSNGDGIGDLRGIISELPHLKDLGVNVIWLSPMYKSPNADNGYDISDYQDIMTAFGTMADFDDLLREVHQQGLKLKDDKSYEDALQKFKDAVNIDGKNKEALYQVGWCFNEAEKYDDALTYLQRAKALMPDEAKVYFELGYAYDMLEKTDDAITYYNETLEKNEEYYSVYQSIGDIYYTKEKYEDAASNYQKYLDKEPDPENKYYYKLAWCFNDLGKYSEALDYMDKYAPEKDDEYSKKYCEIGYADFKLEKQDDAIVAYKKALEYNPDYGTALRGLGDVYYENEDGYDKAIENYEKALEQDEDNSKACYYKLGWLYNDATEYDKSIDVLKKAIDYNEEDGGAREEIGYAYYMKDDNSSAELQLKKAVELDNKSKLGYYYLGLVYLDNGDKTSARAMYDSYIMTLKQVWVNFAACSAMAFVTSGRACPIFMAPIPPAKSI